MQLYTPLPLYVLGGQPKRKRRIVGCMPEAALRTLTKPEQTKRVTELEKVMNVSITIMVLICIVLGPDLHCNCPADFILQ
jgi:hypothetical protein